MGYAGESDGCTLNKSGEGPQCIGPRPELGVKALSPL